MKHQGDLAPAPNAFRMEQGVARSVWNLRPTTLPAVCEHLDLPLRHHDVLSDAEACAGIVLAAAKVTSAERVVQVGAVRSREPWRRGGA